MTEDGSIIITGPTLEDLSGNITMQISEIDSNGIFVWAKNYTFSGYNINCIISQSIEVVNNKIYLSGQGNFFSFVAHFHRNGEFINMTIVNSTDDISYIYVIRKEDKSLVTIGKL